MRYCEVGGCDRKHYGRGFCQMHYYRWRTVGDPLVTRVGHRYGEIDPAQRLTQRSVRQGQCILYMAGRPQRSGHRNMGFQGKYVGVHRIAWILAHGDPGELKVCHRCDVPNCINIEHLFLGTTAENNADRDRKGRHQPLRGSKNGHSRLTEYQVIEIRRMLTDGQTQRAVAAEFGVSQYAIWAISTRKRWTHVQEATAWPK